MFGLKKSPLHRNARNHSVNPGFGGYPSSNPFDSDNKETIKPVRRTSSEPSPVTPHLSTNTFDDDDDIKQTHSSAYSVTSTERNKYKNEFRDSGGFENQTVQELENYAVHKAEETTKSVNNCLRIAEDIRQDATKTVITLHQQGEQITRTHLTAADIDHDLSRVWFLSLLHFLVCKRRTCCGLALPVISSWTINTHLFLFLQIFILQSFNRMVHSIVGIYAEW